MILVDTSVWVDHLSSTESALQQMLRERRVLCHPLVVGELAMGSLKNRSMVLTGLDRLKRVVIATDFEVRSLVEARALFGAGISYLDAHLLTSAYLTPETVLWTRDKRLHTIAATLGIAFQEARPN
jgi:predicted nucleic acid-binding protein